MSTTEIYPEGFNQPPPDHRLDDCPLPPPLDLPDLANPNPSGTRPVLSKPPPRRRQKKRKAPASAALSVQNPVPPPPLNTVLTVLSRASGATNQTNFNVGDGEHTSPGENTSGSSNKKKERKKISPAVVASFAHEPLDCLRKRVEENAEYERLTAEDKIEIEEAFADYQRALLVIAGKNKLHVKPVMDYVGQESRIRGPTNFNNFCVYDDAARPIYTDSSIPYRQRMVQCAELWDTLSKKEKDLWKDEQFLDSIIKAASNQTNQTNGNEPTNGAAPSNQNGVSRAPARQRYLPRDKFKISVWSRKVKRDLRRLSTSHHVEGFLVLASRDPDRPILITGGSLMAEEFLDMTAKDSCQWNSFFRFVNGQQAIKDVSGKFPVQENKRKRRRGTDGDDPECPYDEGSKVANCKRVRVELREALRKATHGVYRGGWPGTKTAEKLAKLKVTLSVKNNDAFVTAADFCHRPSDMSLGTSQRVLTAFAKGWVKLTGPPPPEAVVGGLSTVGHDPSNAAVGNNPVPSTPSANQPGTQVATRPLKGIIRRPKKTAHQSKSICSDSKDETAPENSSESENESSARKEPNTQPQRPKRALPKRQYSQHTPQTGLDDDEVSSESEGHSDHPPAKKKITFRIESDTEDDMDDW
ncbi:hypothetical protein PGTUg99_015456 [Puccinia graminis f. sp. tritici]|uniref:Uncharacterized protein n=1 Tax=Puccinia graminis f. sp. tritici TaxID=56615 RepID=A0A5B0RYF4_PUCGR|nr:hypothetical protein PGTUg99_015456 [Puccinia graminis f. sp. tritici]